MKETLRRRITVFRDKLPLGNYVLYVFIILLALTALCNIVGNSFNNFPLRADIKWVFALLVCGLGLYLLHKDKYVEQYKIFVLLLLMMYAIFPSWIYSGGDTTVALIYLLLITIEAFLMLNHNVPKYCFGGISILYGIGITYLVTFRPDLIQESPGQNVFADTILQIVMVFILGIASVGIYTNRYRRQHTELLELNKRLENMADTDELTGVYSRRKILSLLTRGCEDGGPFYVVMLDADAFKSINDTYGHLVGDRVICHMASHFVEAVGECGCVGRYGGDEFMILLCRLPAEKLAEFGEKLLDIPDYKGCPPLTISAGLVQYRPGLSDDDLVSLADGLLLRAKAAGRNRLETDLVP
ncbi:MAG: GGDEF domain-containing protein [Oscillospiraceae bacterium]